MVLKTPEIAREMLQELQKFVQERWRRVFQRATITGGRWCRKRADLPCFLLLFPSLPAVRVTITCNSKKNTHKAIGFSCSLFFSVLLSGYSPGSIPFGSAAMDFISSSTSGGAASWWWICGRAWRSKEKLSWPAVVGRSCCCCGARWRKRGWICRRHRREKADCSAPVGAAAATAGGRSWRRRRCDELCWRETVLLHGEAPSLLEKEETEGKGAAGLCFWRRRRVVWAVMVSLAVCGGGGWREGETEGKTCERGAAACVEENGVGSSCGEGKEKWWNGVEERVKMMLPWLCGEEEATEN